MNKKSYMIHIDYEEFKTETYNGVQVFDENRKITLFNTGDYEKDYNDAVDFATKRSKEVICMSSVDHFFMDLNYDEDDYEFEEEE